MFVKDQMSPHPFTITPESTILAAQRMMQENKIRHLPVVNPSGGLLGLLTRTTLEEVLPSKLTTLSVYELHYQLEKIKVRDAMVRKVITVTEDLPIEQAARLMWDNKIGCLPVVRRDRLVGIVTDHDLIDNMLDLLGARQPGLRLTLTIPDEQGEIAKITSAIAAQKGDITALGMLPAEEPLRWSILVKVRYADQEQLVAAIKAISEVELIDVRSE